jgi:enamine deaminase RidA (YjgF/YER057c/UK114 family)
MASDIQKAIDETNPGEFDAIVLIYGLCNYGIKDLHGELPVVVPRAHDCITLFMGSRKRYMEYMQKNHGAYFIAGMFGLDENGALSDTKAIQEQRQEFAEKYGEENADYLMETIGDPLKHYSRLTFINSGLGDVRALKEKVRDIALSKQWTFDEYPGDLSLIEKVLDGEWNKDDFLVLKSGEKIAPSYDEGIITAIER